VATKPLGAFPASEYQRRLHAVREKLVPRRLRGCVIAAPENVYYLTGLDHQGYFAVELLVVPVEGTPVLVTRAMERATVRDQVPWIRHLGYSDGVEPLPRAQDASRDLVLSAKDDRGRAAGLRPWEMSFGVAVRGPIATDPAPAMAAAIQALGEAGLDHGAVGVEQQSAFLPYHIVAGVLESLPGVQWADATGLVDDIRLIQSPLEQERTRAAAIVADSMMRAALATAGSGVHEREVMAAIYGAMFQRGGTYPGFVPLVRSTRTLEHEHGTWREGRLRSGDILFLEMGGCVRRYHAPIGRLAFVGRARSRSTAMQKVCEDALYRAAEAARPGAKAGDVYRAWQDVVDRAGLVGYQRHHCGYAVGIGFPPSWSGSGTPRGLRAGSDLELKEGMVFHLMSWLLRTGRGDFFLSDTVLIGPEGAEFLTQVPRSVNVVR
jgi:Xaa-Pro dipeptidase